MNPYDKACAELNGVGREALLTTMPVLCELARMQTEFDAWASTTAYSPELELSTNLTSYDVDALVHADNIPFTFPRFNFRIDVEDKTVYQVSLKDSPLSKVTGIVTRAYPFSTGAGMPYKPWGIAMWADGDSSIVVLSKLAELIATSYVMYLEDVEHMCEDFIVTPDTVWFNARSLALLN